MIKIGITGGIGSGKTTVSKVFQLLGVPVYYSDDEAKKLLDENEEVNKSIVNVFGKEVMHEHALVDRKKLAAIVFNNKEKLAQLNAIVHPAVGKHFDNWLKQQHTPYVLKEAAILFESGAYKQVDKTIVVTAPMELKVARVVKRDKVEAEEVIKRINNQMSDEDKVKRSDFVITNDETSLVIPQVLSIHENIMRMCQK